MFDSSRTEFRTQNLRMDIGQTDGGPFRQRPSMAMVPGSKDPVAMLRMLEERLAQSEESLQAQISQLSVRLSRLENDVASMGHGTASPDLRDIERAMGAIADRLTRLEDRAA